MALYRVKTGASDGFFTRVLDKKPQTGAAGFVQRVFSDDAAARSPDAPRGALFKDTVRGAIFGNPVDAARELRDAGTTRRGNFRLGRGLKSFYRNSFVPKNRERKWWARGLNHAATAMNIGLPMIDLAAAAVGPPEHRGEALGRSTLSLLASPFTSRLGIPGALFVSPRISDLGGAIGRRFDPAPPTIPQGEVPE